MRCGVLILLAVLLAPGVAQADITVTTNTPTVATDGFCSLPEAIGAANAPGTPSADCPGAVLSGTTTIHVPFGTVTTVELTVASTADVAVAGGGRAQTTLTNSAGRVFHVATGGKLALRDLTIANSGPSSPGVAAHGTDQPTAANDDVGSAGGPGSAGQAGAAGGALLNDGTTTITDVAFAGNHAGPGQIGGRGGNGGAGGAAVNFNGAKGGTGGNGALGGAGGDGGAIANTGTLTVTDSFFSANHAGDGGDGGAGGQGGAGGHPAEGTDFSCGDGAIGGIGAVGGKGGSGGAIFNSGTGTAMVTNSTFNGDAAGAGGAGGHGGNGGDGGHPPNSAFNGSPQTVNHGGHGGTGQGGAVGGAAGGGGALSSAGTLTLTGVEITGALAGAGGAGSVGGFGGASIHGTGGDSDGGAGAAGAAGTSGGEGGGVQSTGTLTLTQSTIRTSGAGSGGSGGDGGWGGAGGSGGVNGLPANAGTGAAGGRGGAVSAASGDLSITNSTLVQNASGTGGDGGDGGTAPGFTVSGVKGGDGGTGGSGGAGGGVYLNLTGAHATLKALTVTDGTVGPGGAGGQGGFGQPAGSDGGSGGAGTVGGIDSATAGVTLASSIMASNTAPQCTSMATDGHDISFGDPSCTGPNTNPQLGSLQDNGGPTPTRVSLAPAVVDQVTSGTCLATDQRRVPRPQGAHCDIGAVEVGPAPTCQTAAVSTPFQTAVALPLTCTSVSGAPLTFAIGTPPAHGTLGPVDQAQRSVLYTPASSYSGDDAVAYRASSVEGTSGDRTIAVTVGAPPAPTGAGTPPVTPPPDPTVGAPTACLSTPSVARDRSVKAPGGGKVTLVTRQVDDAASPVKARVKGSGGASVRSVTYTVNGRPLAPTAAGAVPTAMLKIGSRANKVVATVTLKNRKKVKITQLLVVLRCSLPATSCRIQTDGHSLKCNSKTPLGAKKVRVTVLGVGGLRATGSATVSKGRYTVTVRSSSPLPAGRYLYKHVATTKKKGEKLFMVRTVNVT